MSRTAAFAVLAVASALLLAGCEARDVVDAPPVGTPTGTSLAACEAAGFTGLTYAVDVKPFVDTVCVVCHDGTPEDAPIPGVPIGTDFRTREGILVHANIGGRNHVDEFAGANPSGTVVNTAMPPLGFGTLTLEQRQILACWMVTPGQP